MLTTASACSVESDEVPVISNELLEANVVAIRSDLSDLRTEFRAVVTRIDQDVRAIVARIDQDVRTTAAKAENEIKTAVARMDEQFREVRQDIRELRADNKILRDKIDGNYISLEQKIDANYAALDKKIDVTAGELRADMTSKTSERASQISKG